MFPFSSLRTIQPLFWLNSLSINSNPFGIISGSTLKIIGCILMLIDHIGYHLYPKIEILRIIGRLSMPIFAFLISEGCFYTKNKL